MIVCRKIPATFLSHAFICLFTFLHYFAIYLQEKVTTDASTLLAEVTMKIIGESSYNKIGGVIFAV